MGGWKRYESLTDREKQAVEAVMDAILAAHDEGGNSDDRQSEAQKSPLEASGSEEATLAADNPGIPTDRERMEAEWGDEPA